MEEDILYTPDMAGSLTPEQMMEVDWIPKDIHLIMFLGVTALISLYITWKSETKEKLILFMMSFFLMTGNMNKALGVNPQKLIMLGCIFVLFRQFIINRKPIINTKTYVMPWFEVFFYIFFTYAAISQVYNLDLVGFDDVKNTILNMTTVVIAYFTLRVFTDKPMIEGIAKAIIIGAIISSVFSIIQIAIDPLFMRIGGARIAFGTLPRANGTFVNEYFNSYFLIIGLVWTIIYVKSNTWRMVLMGLFSLGVVSSFQRMSWLILMLVITIYLLKIANIKIERLILAGFAGATLMLAGAMIFMDDVMSSSMVEERLSEVPSYRLEYWNLALSNIDDKPVFGFGTIKDNEVYYVGMVNILGVLERATGEEGDLHSGYFGSMFYFGVPAAIFFIIFVIMTPVYFNKLMSQHIFFVIPFLLSLLYLIGNLTNTFLLDKPLAFLVFIHYGLAMGARQNPESLGVSTANNSLEKSLVIKKTE